MSPQKFKTKHQSQNVQISRHTWNSKNNNLFNEIHFARMYAQELTFFLSHHYRLFYEEMAIDEEYRQTLYKKIRNLFKQVFIFSRITYISIQPEMKSYR